MVSCAAVVTFVEPAFVAFLVAVLVAVALLRKRRWQNPFLLVASCVFYGWHHPWYVALLLLSAGVDYASALLMERLPTKKGAFLALSLTTNLGLLGWFKYHDFFSANLAAAGAALGHPVGWTPLAVLLPVGISFYTFQTLAYTIDVYRGQLRACRNPVDYFLFVTFFPQLVAGPIERASHLLSQLEAERRITRSGLWSGLLLAAWGAFKKLALADTIAPYVDRVFSLEHASLPLLLAGGLAFAVQILADFSGYTDIARGVARALGFELMDNFDHPYLAASPSELWRRWHISFSRWIRDYVFIPLGGSRGGFPRAAAVTFAAMLTSGLWHGASWNFVLWGAWHATFLVAWRLLPAAVPRPVGVALTFTVTVLGWVCFRQTDLDRLWWSLSHPLVFTFADMIVMRVVLALTALCAAPLLLALLVERVRGERQRGAGPSVGEVAFLSSVATVLFFVARDGSADFIYFRF